MIKTKTISNIFIIKYDGCHILYPFNHKALEDISKKPLLRNILN